MSNCFAKNKSYKILTEAKAIFIYFYQFSLDILQHLEHKPYNNNNNELKMAPPQRMRVANEKASKYITMRGNVPKSSVRL